MKEISLNTRGRTQFLEITGEVQQVVRDSGLTDGLVTVFIPHTTAGVTINEHADPDVVRDMDVVLDRMVPWEGGYRHAEGNTAAHVKAAMMGSSAHVMVRGGRLQLGTWQGIFFCEFDGPRRRKAWIDWIEGANRAGP
jgi:secondary thiamine-phosphate synthase enzyme